MNAELKNTEQIEQEEKSFEELLRANGFRRMKDVSNDYHTDYWEKKIGEQFQIVKFHTSIKNVVHSAVMVGMIDCDDMVRIKSNSKYYNRKQLVDRLLNDYHSFENIVFMDGVIVNFKL